MNIIESLQEYLGQRKAEKQLKSKDNQWHLLQDARNNIPIDYINNLQLINDVLAGKGRHTQYLRFLSYQMWYTSNSY